MHFCHINSFGIKLDSTLTLAVMQMTWRSILILVFTTPLMDLYWSSTQRQLVVGGKREGKSPTPYTGARKLR